MFAREVDCIPEPLTLARRIATRTFPTLLRSSPGESRYNRFSWLACDPDGESHATDPLEGARADQVSSPALASFPRFIGVLPYEAQRAMERAAWSPPEDRPAPPMRDTLWLRYPAVARVDATEGRVMVAGRSRAAVDDLARLLSREHAELALPLVDVEVVDEEPKSRHVERVRRAIELIEAGDLYQVNLARRLGLRIRGDVDWLRILALFVRFAHAAPSPFGAFFQSPQGMVLSTSPELCLHAEGARDGHGFGKLTTDPIKGTRPRGVDASADARLIDELDADPKERAELAMIIDVERNDLHRVAIPGSVQLESVPRVVTHRTVHHRVATLTAQSRPGVSREEVLRAMIPSGSVTGAPKIRAMEVIRGLEPARRGLYTGAFGYQAHDGTTLLAMAIRTLVLEPSLTTGEYWAGGGIVVSSSPERELAETDWKATQLRALLES